MSQANTRASHTRIWVSAVGTGANAVRIFEYPRRTSFQAYRFDLVQDSHSPGSRIWVRRMLRDVSRATYSNKWSVIFQILAGDGPDIRS
jgi:hypothetical protein